MSELNTQIADAVLVDTGTLTDERICEYESTGTQLECTLVKDSSGTCAANSVCLGGHAHGETYYTESESNTNFVSRNTWTDIDSYPSACTGANFVKGIGDSLSCSVPTDTNTNANTVCSGTWTLMDGDGNCDTFLGSLVGDTSPQLGGYLDTNAQNIGSTADEIENIYITTNNKVYLGTGQEGEIYYDGSKLVIKLN